MRPFYRFKLILAGIFVGVFIFTSANRLEAGEGDGGLLYGQDHAIKFNAPPGWVLDNKSGVEQGLHAVFYPKGSSWSESLAVMYINTITKDGRKFEEVVANDVAGFKKSKAMDAGAFPTSDGKKAMVKYFLPISEGNYEAVAYVDENNIVALLVMSSRDRAHFQSSLPAFQKLIASYQFLARTAQTGQKYSTIQYVIPPDILLIAKDASKSAKGEKYENELGPVLGPHFAGYMKACVEPTNTITDITIVLKVEKDGQVSGVYADHHNAVNDCLAPKLQGEKFPPPPYTPYYELVEIKIK